MATSTSGYRSKKPPSLQFIHDNRFDSVSESPILSPIVPPSVKTKLHHWAPKDVANELCLMDSELIRRIKPEELKGGAWMKKDKLTKAPNIMAMVYASNDLALLVPTEVLSESTVPAMAKAIIIFIEIAIHCHKLNNYNSLKAILAGLQSTPIYRLKNTWKDVPSKKKKKFEELSQLMSEEYSWRAYSNHLAMLIDSTTPCVPFLGVLLTTAAQHQQGSSPGGSKRRISTGVEDYTVLEAITVRNRLETIRKSVGKQPHWSTDDMPFIIEDPHSHEKIVESRDGHSRYRILSEILTNRDDGIEPELNRSFSCDEICQFWVDQQPEFDDPDMDNEPILSKTTDTDIYILNGMDSPSIVINGTEPFSILDSNNTRPSSALDSNGDDSPWGLEDIDSPAQVINEASRPRTSRASSTSSIPPMRKRSSCFSFKSSRKNSRFSQFSIEIPAFVLKERRRPSTLLTVLHDSKDPLELLGCYQLHSLGASAGLTTNSELRTIICNSHKNTEAVNYKMSYFREP